MFNFNMFNGLTDGQEEKIEAEASDVLSNMEVPA